MAHLHVACVREVRGEDGAEVGRAAAKQQPAHAHLVRVRVAVSASRGCSRGGAGLQPIRPRGCSPLPRTWVSPTRSVRSLCSSLRSSQPMSPHSVPLRAGAPARLLPAPPTAPQTAPPPPPPLPPLLLTLPFGDAKTGVTPPLDSRVNPRPQGSVMSDARPGERRVRCSSGWPGLPPVRT